MNRPRTYFASDFEKPAKRIARAWLVPVLFVMLVVSLVAAMAFGAWFQRDQDKRLAAIKAAEPKRVEPALAAALTQWRCDAEEFSEHRRTCAARKRSDLIEKLNPNTKGKL